MCEWVSGGSGTPLFLFCGEIEAIVWFREVEKSEFLGSFPRFVRNS